MPIQINYYILVDFFQSTVMLNFGSGYYSDYSDPFGSKAGMKSYLETVEIQFYMR